MKASLETLYYYIKETASKQSLYRKQSPARKTVIIIPAYGFQCESGWEQAVLSKEFHTGSRG